MAEIDLIVDRDRLSPISEAYRGVRINLQFAGAGKQLEVIGVTSSSPGEGKSTTIANLAAAMAQDKKKVLLIDCDLRKPVQHKRFEIEQDGVTNYIVRGTSPDSLVHEEVLPGLDVLASGPIPPNPSELLSSSAMDSLLKWARDNYDVVLVDLPPIMAVSDVAVLGHKLDGVVLVVGSGSVSPAEAREAKRRLLQANVSILGAVVNKVPQKRKHGYYQYYYEDEKL